VVHPMPARSARRAPLSPRPGTSVGDTLQAERPVPMPYVFIPDPLIVAFAHDPLAVGVYVAIARLAMVAKAAVPLAARDLVAWMGSDRDADRAAIMRRIVKLEQGGWVLIERTTASKHQLLPTWGRDQAGQARPWRFDTADSGRPSHLRGRRVPLTLFDDYLGRLDPQAGQGAALVSRYFTQPLLDLTDIGAYTIGLRAEIMPTPRLRHLGLHSAIGMLPPLDGRSLLEQAAAGTLTTLMGDVKVSVLPSIQGQVRLGAVMPIALRHDPLHGEYLCGSIRRSSDGSIDGSRDMAAEAPILSRQDGQSIPTLQPAGLSFASANKPVTYSALCRSTKSATSRTLNSTPSNPPCCTAAMACCSVVACTPIAPGLSALYVVASLFIGSDRDDARVYHHTRRASQLGLC
jgi:hypothetical protein